MTDESHDPGAYIGHEPEFEAETIPGGISRKDQRVSATDTESTGVGALERRNTEPERLPDGHRQGHRVDDDDLRRAGENG